MWREAEALAVVVQFIPLRHQHPPDVLTCLLQSPVGRSDREWKFIGVGGDVRFMFG